MTNTCVRCGHPMHEGQCSVRLVTRNCMCFIATPYPEETLPGGGGAVFGPSGSVTLTQIEYDDLLARGERIARAIEAQISGHRLSGTSVGWRNAGLARAARIARETT